MLLRFLDYEGSVTLGGVELSALDGDEARTAIGLVAQDAHVFDTTVRENLLLARRDATEADLEAAVARARLTALDLTREAGPGGHRLSGGERRRIALARAELARFPLLILDEPGEHLDAPTADAILADALPTDRGTLLITHRLAGLRKSDGRDHRPGGGPRSSSARLRAERTARARRAPVEAAANRTSSRRSGLVAGASPADAGQEPSTLTARDTTRITTA